MLSRTSVSALVLPTERPTTPTRAADSADCSASVILWRFRSLRSSRNGSTGRTCTSAPLHGKKTQRPYSCSGAPSSSAATRASISGAGSARPRARVWTSSTSWSRSSS